MTTNYADWINSLSERDFHAHMAGRLEAPDFPDERRPLLATVAVCCASAALVGFIALTIVGML